MNVSSNDLTLQSYESGVNEYIAGTAAEASGTFKAWMDKALGLLPSPARIIEIGSGFGRDARYMESMGFTVERTDATEQFVSLLQEMGSPARKFNILTDDFSATYDLVFANAVFLHFTEPEMRMVLGKVKTSLNKGGILAFSVKKGEGEEWSSAKLGRPRYFHYWTFDKLQSLLESAGLELVSLSEDDKFLQIISH